MVLGNFFGMLPESMVSSQLTGVELDSISGRIARKLYPNADIKITGYENTKFADNSFDVAIGNVPFGDYSLHDKRYDKDHLLIHDYSLLRRWTRFVRAALWPLSPQRVRSTRQTLPHAV